MKKITLEEHFASRASPRHHDQMRSAPGKLAKNRRCKSPTGQGLANHPDPE
jgi:hypothetical protein